MQATAGKKPSDGRKRGTRRQAMGGTWQATGKNMAGDGGKSRAMGEARHATAGDGGNMAGDGQKHGRRRAETWQAKKAGR